MLQEKKPEFFCPLIFSLINNSGGPEGREAGCKEVLLTSRSDQLHSFFSITVAPNLGKINYSG
jgi:hypothetical protein